MLSGASRATLCKVFPVQCCPRRWYSLDNIGQIKNLFSVVREAPDNNAKEKILFNVVLILLWQQSTGQNSMQCSPRGSRQHCTGKILCNVALILLGQHYTGRNLMQCCPWGSRKQCMHIKKSCSILSFNTLETTLHRLKSFAVLSERLQTTMHKNISCSMLS